MEALVGQKGDLEFDPVLDRKPVEGFEEWCDVVVLPHPHQDPGSTILCCQSEPATPSNGVAGFD